jgi:CAAX protease family protein
MLSLLRRILLSPLLVLVWTGLLASGLFRILQWLAPSIAALPNIALGGALRNAALTTLILALSVWLFQRKRLRDIGLDPARAISDTARGFLLGAALLTTVVGVLALLGSYRIIGWAPLPEGIGRGALLGQMLFFLLAVAIFEELSVRGIVFRLLEQGVGTWVAIVVSACFFGFGHRSNPGATLLSGVAIAIEAGALFAASYVATRSLWVPLGLHWAWNFFEGPVWGTRVSGMDLSTLVRADLPGPRLLTGGAFGPEAGVVAMVLGAALGTAFLVVAVRREQIVTPGWMRWIASRVRSAAAGEQPASPPAAAVPPSAA